MNRLVIIGNGFDLAHGLPTSYKDFIDDYWKTVAGLYKNQAKSSYTDNFINVEYSIMSAYLEKAKGEVKNIKTYKDFTDFIEVYKSGTSYNRYQFGDENGCLIEFKNYFFRLICIQSIENWVDIENVYYKLLKESLNGSKSIIEINTQFEEVKFLLEKYLIKNIEESFEFSEKEAEEFMDIFNDVQYEGEFPIDRFYFELPKKDEIEFEKSFEKERLSLSGDRYLNYKKSISIKNYFLSFNYTSTVFEYNKALGNNLESLIEIHGRLQDERNPINFGFGDEMDKHYQEIEEKNYNEYLKNIKSFQYLHTSNYKRLLDLIDSEKFQVYIMGHSCGLSDRTLLNTIFEHENCCSIKIFYHQKEDGSDNYTEITQNISRHFNKKKLMREKIVNKTLCQPLPQIQLPKKE